MSANYPNEPSGSTPFYSTNFNSYTMTPGDGNTTGVLYDIYSSLSDDITSPGGSGTQTSPTGVLRIRTEGGNGAGQADMVFGSYRREVFLGFTWRHEVYGYANNNNKLIFIKEPSNSFMVLQGSPGRNSKRLKWYQQEPIDNSHVPGYGPFFWDRDRDGTGWFEPNVNASAADVAWGGPWTKVELYLKASTTNVSRDGIIRLWVNGVLSTNLTNVNQGCQTLVNGQSVTVTSPGGFRRMSINNAWDGTAGVLASPGFEEWRHFWDDLYLSFPNGGTTNPDNPVGAPATPTGLVVTAQ